MRYSDLTHTQLDYKAYNLYFDFFKNERKVCLEIQYFVHYRKKFQIFEIFYILANKDIRREKLKEILKNEH